MSTYAIGDIQGCYSALKKLLKMIDFKAGRDRLWFTGDLVNRGPDSLKTLRFARKLGDHAVTVLGNHDLHLLAVGEGLSDGKPDDSLDDIIHAEDSKKLLNWLRQRPLMHHDPKLGFSMIHAGLPPQWDFKLAQQCAHELEAVLRGSDYKKFLRNMYGNKPERWSNKLKGMERLRFITNCFTRLRYCNDDGTLCLKAKGPPGSQPQGCLPWFDVQDRASCKMKIVFGHWSALGLHRSKGIYALDSGCLWGGELTALRLEDKKYFSVRCHKYQHIN